VFCQEAATPAEALQAVVQLLPNNAKKICRWAFRKTDTSRLPPAYVLPKGKKQFLSARPIIPFAGHVAHTIHQVAGKVLMCILEEVYREVNFNMPTTQKAIDAVKRFSNSLKDRDMTQMEIAASNEDISGFFLAAPQERLQNSLATLLQRHSEIRGRSLDQIWWTLQKSSTKKTTCTRGKAQGKQFPENILVDIARHALTTSIFTVGNVVFRQVRGALIGSPLSPALSLIPIIEAEWQFLRSLGLYRLQWKHTWHAIRYVDNRLCLFLRKKTPLMPSALFNKHFYDYPLELEPEPSMSFLGSDVLVSCNTIEMQFEVPGFLELAYDIERGQNSDTFTTQQWRYKSPISAGSVSHLKVGLDSKLHDAVRKSFPIHRAQIAITQLFAVAAKMSFHGKDLKFLLNKHQRRYIAVYSDEFVSSLLNCLHSSNNVESLVNLASCWKKKCLHFETR
jgi:hypothetical protein